MNRSQRRLLRHHRPAGLPAIALPALAQAGPPRADGDRVRVAVAPGAFRGEASLPARPVGWLLVAADPGTAVPAPEGWATLSLAPGSTADDLLAAHRWLGTLPETRALPTVLAGAGVSGRRSALEAVGSLGPAAPTLLLDGPADGPVVLSPVHEITPGDDIAAADALRALARPTAALNHGTRRRLAHRLERTLRRDARRRAGGTLTGRARTGIAILAGALSLGLAAGVAPAAAAVTASHSDGTLKAVGDGADDEIVIDCQGGLGAVRVNGATVSTGGVIATCATISSYAISGEGGHDTLRALLDGSAFPGVYAASISIAGGEGNDTLEGFEAAATTLDGGTGSDSLQAGPVPTTLIGGAGNDTLDGADTATDTATFPGAETINADLLLGSVVATGVAAAGTDVALGIDTLVGTAGDDTIVGSVGPESLVGAGGADTILAGHGNDTLVGGSGEDSLFADLGLDVLSGGTENDTLRPGPGTDTVNGGAGSDMVGESTPISGPIEVTNTQLFGNGTDTLTSIERASLQGNSGDSTVSAATFDGVVTLFGGAGNDTLISSVHAHDDVLSGGADDDLLIASVDGNSTLSFGQLTGRGTDVINTLERVSLQGGTGPDTITAGLGTPTTVNGGAGADDLRASLGTVVLEGAAGNDTLRAGSTSTTVNGGADTDRLLFSRDVNQTLTDAGIAVTGTPVTFVGGVPEQVSLSGSAGNNVIDASAYTSPGVTLHGSTGNDTLTGPLTAGASLDGSTGDDVLTGGMSHDTLNGSTDDDTLTGADGHDSLDASTGNDSILGGLGNDTLGGSSGGDTLDGGDGHDSLDAGNGVDSLIGGDGNDTLNTGFGGDVPETVSGGSGVDAISILDDPVLIDGGTGDDTLTTGFGLNIAATNTSYTVDGTVSPLTSIEAFATRPLASAQLIDLSALTIPATVDGGGGDDTIVASSGPSADVFIGGAGTDELRRTADVDQTLTADQLIGAGTDAVTEFERAALTGGPSGNRLDASAFPGPVTLDGQGGPDTLLGGLAIDNLLGGPGEDSIDSRDAGVVDAVDCGADTDVLLSDPADTQAGCETVNGASTLPPAPAPAPTPDPAPPGDGAAGGAGTVVPPPAGDRTAPRITLTGARTQRAGSKAVRVKVTFACDEACTTTAAGTIAVSRRVKVKNRTRTRTTKLRMKTTRATVTRAGQRRTLTLTLTKKQTRTLLRLLRSRTTRRVSVPIKLTAVDTAGNRAKVATRTVRITKPKR